MPPLTQQHESAVVGAMAASSNWRELLPELLHQSSTYLCSPAFSLRFNIRPLWRLSAVCAAWRGAVYRESSSGHVDFWSCIAAVSVAQHTGCTPFCNMNVERVSRSSVPPPGLLSFRLVRSLSLWCCCAPFVCSIAALIHPLQRYSRLTSLNIDFACLQLSSDSIVETQDALNAALAAIGDGGHHCLKSFSLQCPTGVHPKVDALRRLCSSVHQLSLSAHELLLMAWGSDTLYDRVWETHSVSTFVLPAPSNYLGKHKVIATLAASLPSCTQLHVDHEQEASSVSKLLRRLNGPLAFLRGSTASLLQLPSAAISCTWLVSLCIFDRDSCNFCAEQLSAIFASLTTCPSLAELSVIARSRDAWPSSDIVYLCTLLQMRHLHFHIYRRLDFNPVQSQLPWSILTPNLTHLALVVHHSQHTSLLDSIDSHRLQQLTHCHVSCVDPRTERSEWAEARARLKERLGAVWCEKEEEVVRWRADRVWRRSVGLSDPAEDYS